MNLEYRFNRTQPPMDAGVVFDVCEKADRTLQHFSQMAMLGQAECIYNFGPRDPRGAHFHDMHWLCQLHQTTHSTVDLLYHEIDVKGHGGAFSMARLNPNQHYSDDIRLVGLRPQKLFVTKCLEQKFLHFFTYRTV